MKNVYNTNLFSRVKKFPFFYSNFVMTIDGKVQVGTKEGKLYWPIGSKLDFDTLLWLRAHADVLIHGKNTAVGFNTLQSLTKKEYKDKRKKIGKEKDLIYMIISNHPDDRLFQSLVNPPAGIQSVLVTSNQFHQPQPRELKGVKIVKTGVDKVNLHTLTDYFKKNNLKNILIEGGPTLMASFVMEDLLDEMFITISPKLFGNIGNKTKSMIEGYLFPPDKISQFKLISVKNIRSELYLRYRR